MAAGTFTNNQGVQLSVPDNSCAAVKAAGDAYHATVAPAWQAISCSADPVVAGTTILFNQKTNPSVTGSWTITAMTATPSSTGSDSGSGTGTGTVTGTGTNGTSTLTVTVKVEPAPPSAERIADLSILFGLSIAFLVAVWGSKQLLKLFTHDHEKD